MGKKKTDAPSSVQTFAQNVAQAQMDGYVAMPQQYSGGSNGSKKNKKDEGVSPKDMVLNIALAKVSSVSDSPAFVGKNQPADILKGKIAPAVGSIQATPKGVGTDGLGYVSWGVDNRYPNVISWLTSLLPYTATAAKFNVDVAAGMGFTPKYRYAAISNGALMTKEIDYDAAGALLEQQLIDIRLELMKFYQENGDTTSSLHNDITNLGDTTKAHHEDLFSQLEKSYLDRIQRVEEDLKIWSETKDEVANFTQKNNLPLLALHLFNDMVLFNICFPEIEISQQATDQPDNALWKPKATGITYREAHTCRREEFDDQGVSNYIYHSNRWLDQTNVVQELKDQDITAIPSLDPERPIASLDDKLRKFRTNNPNGAPQDRPTRFIYPSFYPTAGHPYYPLASWHSIFGGDIYAYLSTIVSDRFQRRKNKNIIGYIIYVHQDYIRSLIDQRQKELMMENPNRKSGTQLTQKEQRALVDQMWKTINEFLSARDNAGKPLLSFTFTGSDGKDHDAYRIVEVPNATAKDAQAQKAELEEISAIVFFALQCHPELIGSVPGRTGAGGGTYQRELYLLKQCQIAPTQQLVLRVLDTISAFNKWDRHLVWTVRQQVLTTLDNSKTGLTESQNK